MDAALAERLRLAAHPLEAPPSDPGWNLAELDGLLAPGEPRQAAVLVGVVERHAAPTVLLTRRHDGLRHHGGQVSFPGGRIEPGDASPAAAALREAREEVGLSAADARVLGYLDPLRTITGFRVLPVLARIQRDFLPVADPSEVAEVFEVPLALLLDPSRLEWVDLEFAGRPRRVLQFRYDQQRIWGATASILLNLRERLANAPQRG
ncbi:MAG TPA: CoA pyrophosphatase [Thermomonas sp.]|nr:CoA pyrophosphatase [Thermomonas sp.]